MGHLSVIEILEIAMSQEQNPEGHHISLESRGILPEWERKFCWRHKPYGELKAVPCVQTHLYVLEDTMINSIKGYNSV